MPRHRHRKFLRFPGLIDQQTAVRPDLHMIVGNDATHRTTAVKCWIKAHPRFHLATALPDRFSEGFSLRRLLIWINGFGRPSGNRFAVFLR
jgi:hypothetical protein